MTPDTLKPCHIPCYESTIGRPCQHEPSPVLSEEEKEALEWYQPMNRYGEILTALVRRLLSQPCPNKVEDNVAVREAEMAVVEAAKKLNAMWGDAQVNIGPAELEVYRALARLAALGQEKP